MILMLNFPIQKFREKISQKIPSYKFPINSVLPYKDNKIKWERTFLWILSNSNKNNYGLHYISPKNNQKIGQNLIN